MMAKQLHLAKALALTHFFCPPFLRPSFQIDARKRDFRAMRKGEKRWVYFCCCFFPTNSQPSNELTNNPASAQVQFTMMMSLRVCAVCIIPRVAGIYVPVRV